MTSWTNNPASAATRIRTIHINELRAMIDRNRFKLGLAPWPWTDNPIRNNVPIRATHFVELRTAIQDLWTRHSQGNLPSWSAGPPSSSRWISYHDVNDLRGWADRIDPESVIGASWINNTRNFVGPDGTKNGWDVQLVYATNPFPGFDLASVGARIQPSIQAGRRVLVRVDFSGTPPGGQGSQSVPRDDAGRNAYLAFIQTMCQTAAYSHVTGYIIANEFNLQSENGGTTPITPDWYARIFNGYNAPIEDTGNCVQVIKTFQPGAWVLVGPVAPYTPDGDSPSTPWTIPAPWLNYFNGVCQYVYAGAAAKANSVDGFAIHAYGRPQRAPSPSQEPMTDVLGVFAPPLGNAQAGFRVYKDWSDIINVQDSAVRIFVTETNTHTDSPSDQSYPSGWFQNALAELQSAGARYTALCWFVDQNVGGNWGHDALSQAQGNCVQANLDFNFALTQTNY